MFDFSILSKYAKVVFTKLNGEERTMYCTNNLNYIPTSKHPVGKGNACPSYIHNVWDFEKQAWRSFDGARVSVLEEISESDLKKVLNG